MPHQISQLKELSCKKSKKDNGRTVKMGLVIHMIFRQELL